MDEHNQPYYLPCGRLLSQNAIATLKQEHRLNAGIGCIDGNFKCPITGKELNESCLRKVFFS